MQTLLERLFNKFIPKKTLDSNKSVSIPINRSKYFNEQYQLFFNSKQSKALFNTFSTSLKSREDNNHAVIYPCCLQTEVGFIIYFEKLKIREIEFEFVLDRLKNRLLELSYSLVDSQIEISEGKNEIKEKLKYSLKYDNSVFDESSENYFGGASLELEKNNSKSLCIKVLFQVNSDRMNTESEEYFNLADNLFLFEQ
jgi:hypothetical protein